MDIGKTGNYSFITFRLDLDFPNSLLKRMDVGIFDDIDDARLYATMVHEKTHLLQNLATSYGLWKTSHLLMAGNNVLHIASSLQQEGYGGKLIMPLDELAPRGVPYQEDDLFSHFMIASLPYRRIACVDGPSGLPKKNWIFSNISPPADYTSPRMKDIRSDQICTFGTKDLIEGNARASELAFIKNADDISSDIASQLYKELAFFIPYQSFLGLLDYATQEPTSSTFHLSLILADLALNPMIPIDFGEDLLKITWEEFNPAYRYVLMADAIRENKLKFDNKCDIKSYQKTLLSIMKWNQQDLCIKTEFAKIEQMGLDRCFPKYSIRKLLELRQMHGTVLGNWPLNGIFVEEHISKQSLNVEWMFLNYACQVAFQMYYYKKIKCPLHGVQMMSKECDEKCLLNLFIKGAFNLDIGEIIRRTEHDSNC